VDDAASAGVDVEQLDVAAEVVAVGREGVWRRSDQPHVAENRLLGYVRVVRTEVDPDVGVLAQLDTLEAADRVGVAEAGDRHRVRVALPLQLQHVGPVHLGPDLLGVGAWRPPELQRREAVSVPGHVDVRRSRVERRANHEPDLAVRIDALPDQGNAGLQDEVARDPLPGEVKLVRAEPHVRARGLQRVLLGGRVVDRGAGELHRADVLVVGEDAHRVRGRGCDDAGYRQGNGRRDRERAEWRFHSGSMRRMARRAQDESGLARLHE